MADPDAGRQTGAVADEPEITLGVDDLERGGLHIEEAEGGTPDLEDDDSEFTDGSLVALIDAFAEAFNAHDVDELLELLAADAELPGLGGDVDGLPLALGRLWDECPNAVVVRGSLGGEPVGVLWDVDDAGWVRVALLSFDIGDADGEIGMVELIDDDAIVDEAEGVAPDDEPAEGSRWAEWYEGDGG